MAKTMLTLPDTSMKDYIDAEQAAERIRDGYAEYFRSFDVLADARAADSRRTSTASASSSSTGRRSMPPTFRARPYP